MVPADLTTSGDWGKDHRFIESRVNDHHETLYDSEHGVTARLARALERIAVLETRVKIYASLAGAGGAVGGSIAGAIFGG